MFQNLNDSISLHEQLIIFTSHPIEISIFVILLIIGAIFIILTQNKIIKNFLITNLKWARIKPESYLTDYDNLTQSQLEKIVKKTSDNYRLLITVYGVLLAFVVSANLELAFSRWSFVIWCGWILAIIVRSGSFAMNLSDVIETSNIVNAQVKILVARRIYAAKTFLNHALYLLVVAIAFLPVIFFEKGTTDLPNLPWLPQVSILSIAIAIGGVFFVLYYGGAKIQNFESKSNSKDIWFYTMILVGQMVANPTSSPLQPANVTFFGLGVFQIPLVIEVVTFFGFVIGIAFPFVWLMALITNLRSRISSSVRTNKE